MTKQCTICKTFIPKRRLRCESCTNIFQGRNYVRELVRVRDKHTCQDCKLKYKKGMRRLDVHHLNGNCGKKSKGYDRISDIEGLITLCHSCHLNREEPRQHMKMAIRVYKTATC